MIPIKKTIDVLTKMATTLKEVENQQAIAELQNSMTSAYESYQELMERNMRLQEENGQLKDDIKKYADWEKEKKEYDVYQTPYCVFYRKKGTTILVCPTCFVAKRLAIPLQRPTVRPMGSLECSNCKHTFNGHTGDLEAATQRD